jgi:signal peptidase I
MNKYLKRSLITAGIILLLIVVLRLTGVVSYYVVSTPVNEPNIRSGSRCFFTVFKKPSQGDFVVFKNSYSDSVINNYALEKKYGQHYIFRFCANENDIIEMKQAILFVNGKNADEQRNLYHYYLIASRDTTFIASIYDKKNEENLVQNKDSVMVNLTTEMIKKLGTKIKISLWRSPGEMSETGPFRWYNHNEKNWTIDDFGPISVPKGYCFVLGDNRNNALDSRYVGFIKLLDIKGVKL